MPRKREREFVANTRSESDSIVAYSIALPRDVYYAGETVTVRNALLCAFFQILLW